MTPFYNRDNITIYCGEASEVLSQLDPGSIDLTVTSPPYDNLRTYNGYTFDFEAIAGQLWRVTTAGGVVVWVVGDATVDGSETGTSFRQALGFMGLGFNLHDTMIYRKLNGAMGSNYTYLQEYEFMFVLSKGIPKSVNFLRDRKNVPYAPRSCLKTRSDENGKTDDRKSFVPDEFGRRKNIWDYQVGGPQDTGYHPAIFPEALARDHIISWSNPGDLVCDPMLGSGTVGKMCALLDRRFIGVEISEEYCKIAVERIERVLSQPKLFSFQTGTAHSSYDKTDTSKSGYQVGLPLPQTESSETA